MPERSTRSPGGLLLRFPATMVLLVLLIFNDLTATGVLPAGPKAQVVLLPLLLLSYLVDPAGALLGRGGFPFPGAVEVGLLLLGSLFVDEAMRRAAE